MRKARVAIVALALARTASAASLHVSADVGLLPFAAALDAAKGYLSSTAPTSGNVGGITLSSGRASLHIEAGCVSCTAADVAYPLAQLQNMSINATLKYRF